jgi:plasmid maintenance system antidote protein VapI
MTPRPVVIASPALIRRELKRTDIRTLDELARRAALRPATVSAVMAGRAVSAETIYRLGLALGLAGVRQ